MDFTSVAPISTFLRRTFSGRVNDIYKTLHTTRSTFELLSISSKGAYGWKDWIRTNNNGFYRPICKYLLCVSLFIFYIYYNKNFYNFQIKKLTGCIGVEPCLVVYLSFSRALLTSKSVRGAGRPHKIQLL